MSKKQKNPNMGVYAIINIQNGKMYIGSSINLKNRLATHRRTLKSNQHYNQHLQSAYNKYGKQNFVIKILEYVNDENIIFDREQYYMDKYKVYESDKGYNISRTALGGTCEMTEASKLNLVKSKMQTMSKNSGKYKLEAPDGRYYSLPVPERDSNYEQKNRAADILLEMYSDYCNDHWEDRNVARFLDSISYYLIHSNAKTKNQKRGILSRSRELEFTQGSEDYINFADLNYNDQALLDIVELDIDEHGEEIPYRGGMGTLFVEFPY